MTAASDAVREVAPGVYLIPDTCAVYLVVADRVPGHERTAVAVDFGSGRVLDHLAELGVDRISDVVMTHHHRDQAQGLPRAVAHGAAVHVPPVEVELFTDVEQLWRGRQLANDYNLRQDRFSLLESVPTARAVPEYRTARYGGVELTAVPTPGHTVGSVTYLLDRGDDRVAFTGDLIYAPGKVWSLAATQWSYSHHEGAAMTVLSCLLLGDEHPTLLLPSHGEPMTDAPGALSALAETMQRYVDSRRWHPWDLTERVRSPWVELTPHLLLNRSSLSCCYAVLSETGEALLIDYGYDVTTGLPTGTERASRRPWLASLPALKAQFGVTRIAVAIPTHYHDDHVAGLPLLREVEGAELWVPENVAPVLADPMRYDLPCLWFDPIVADRVLPLGESVRWREHEIRVHAQPGHTLFAAAFELEIDGVRVLFTGDQQENLGVPGERREILNYQYRNRFRIDDYVDSAELYRRVAPGLLLSGHWEPREVEPGYLDYLAEEGRFTADIHRDLLPLEEMDAGADGVLARIEPYRSRVTPGEVVPLVVWVRNPLRTGAAATVRLVAPLGWRATPEVVTRELGVGEQVEVAFDVATDPGASGRMPLAVDVSIGDRRFGQQAEAVVDVRAELHGTAVDEEQE